MKKNKRINDEHDKYMTQQNNKKDESSNQNESNDMNTMLRMNQLKKFHDFDDESKNEQMMKYSKNESMMIFKKSTMSKEKSIIKIKIVKKQVKKLMMFKKLKISDSIKALRNKKRFDI